MKAAVSIVGGVRTCASDFAVVNRRKVCLSLTYGGCYDLSLEQVEAPPSSDSVMH